MAGRIDTAWRGLEEVDGLAATKRHWAAACGQPLFMFVEPFLTPTGDSAEWIPDPTDRLRQMRVIPPFRRKDHEFIAISEVEPRSPDVPLSARDLAIFRLDLPRFGRHLASAMGLGSTRPVKTLSDNAVRLATMPTHGLEVVLVIPCMEHDLPKALDLLGTKFEGKVALVTPTHHSVPPQIRAAIDADRLQHATLGELLALSDDGSIGMIWDPADCFSPAAGVDTGPPYLKWPFDRPPAANWGHVSIGLRSPDILRIKFGDSVREFVARDIVGFVKNTPGQHVSEAWELLRQLASKRGTLPIESSKASQDRVKARRKVLADLLKNFFGLKPGPFATSRREKVWSANFEVQMID
jgi:hypothetical protein